MIQVGIVGYVILCIIVGLFGRQRAFGFWGFLLLSLVFTPVVVGLILALTAVRRGSENY